LASGDSSSEEGCFRDALDDPLGTVEDALLGLFVDVALGLREDVAALRVVEALFLAPVVLLLLGLDDGLDTG
jgi:hypothetical protein